MSVQVSWFIENRVVAIHGSGEVSMEDLHAVDETLQLLVNELPGDVPLLHAVFDTTEMDRLLMNVAGVSQALKILSNPRIGWVLLVGADQSTRVISAIVAQIKRSRFRAFDNWDDALEFLNSNDSTLPYEDVS